MRVSRRKTCLLVVLMSTVVCYIAANLFVVNFVPVLHRFVFTVEVVNESSTPVSGATVGWAGSVHTAPRVLGVTGPNGTLELTEIVQENPLWMWPQIGRFGFAGLVLKVQAPQYSVRDVAPSEALPDIPFSNPVAQVRVLLHLEWTAGDMTESCGSWSP